MQFNESEQKKALLDTREYAWKYWAYHAEQRLKTFNFFILFTSVLIAGSISLLKEPSSPLLAISAGILLIFFSFSFWQLDSRNRNLIKHSEYVLVEIEKNIPTDLIPEELRLISGENAKTKNNKHKYSKMPLYHLKRWSEAPLSFTETFSSIFAITAFFGFCIIFYPLSSSSNDKPESRPCQINQVFIESFDSSTNCHFAPLPDKGQLVPGDCPQSNSPQSSPCP